MTRAAPALVIAAAAALSAMACLRPADDVLSDFAGGFDPLRFDAGALPPARLARPVVFAVPPFYADEVAAGAAGALERYLEESCAFDVNIAAPRAYDEDALLGALARGEIDVAELSPYQYAKAQRGAARITPLAATVARGSASYGSYLVVTGDSPIRSVADLRARPATSTGRERKDDTRRPRLGLVDPLSTSGFLVPALFLADQGVRLGVDVELVLSGGHVESIAALRAGQLDVAAISSDLLIGNVGLSGPLVVIAKAGRMPNDVIVARAELDPQAIALLQRALWRLSIHDPEARAALRAFSAVDGFMPVPPGHYDAVMALAERASSLDGLPLRRLEPAERAP